MQVDQLKQKRKRMGFSWNIQCMATCGTCPLALPLIPAFGANDMTARKKQRTMTIPHPHVAERALVFFLELVV
jgi:hypothetical protein